MPTLWKVLTRRKVLTPDETQETPLARVLNTFDLTALGVGSTLGVGVYVLAGQVAKNIAGPAVIISFLIAAVASVFAGLCYAEFGARAPRAGSAYIYSYLCVGEFVAFVIGWNLILEYIIGSASVAKGMSSYIDNLWDGTLSRTFLDIAPINIPYLSTYFDFFAFVVPVLLSIALAFGMKESSFVNNIFTTLNICVVLFVIIAGSLNAHISNWSIDPNDVKNVTNGTNLGKGGFFPFGIDGVIKGAATCFYGFVGFDCIATTGEEVKNPKKAIPMSIILSLTIIFLAYFGTSTVVTLMIPYYAQDPTAPIPFAFQSIHWHTAALIVSIGAIFGLYASLFGAMFPLPRILYAMSSDGLIFRFMGQVSERFKTPIIGTLCAGLFTGLMAALFNLESLVNMMSIGTLLAYTIVAASVLLLRYSDDEKISYGPISGSSDSEDIEGYSYSPEDIEPINESDDTAFIEDEIKLGIMRTIFNCGKSQVPNKKTELIVSIDICIYCILCFLLGVCALHLRKEIVNRELLPIIAVCVILLLMALTILSILTQPLSKQTLSFQVPWVPLIPAVSILFNIYLMIMLDIATWIRFVVWMILGVIIFLFSRRNTSKIYKKNSTEIFHQGHVNKNFYDEDLSNNVEHSDQNDPFVAPVIINHGGKSIPADLLHNNDDSSRILTPTKVIESLDLVLDSFSADSAFSAVMSVDNVSSVSNIALVQSNDEKSYDYTHATELVEALNIEYEGVNLESAVVKPTYIGDQSRLVEKNSKDSVENPLGMKNECEVIDDNRVHHKIETADLGDSMSGENIDVHLSPDEIVETENRSTNIEIINMKDEHDLPHEEMDEKEVHLSNLEAIGIENLATESVDENCNESTLPNGDRDQNENSFSAPPPPPPFMPDLKSFIYPEADKFDVHKKIAEGDNNYDRDNSHSLTKDYIDDTNFTPPAPPSMTNFNNSTLKGKKKFTSEREVPVTFNKVREDKKNHLPFLDKNSLKLVKLKHVPRPSLEERFIHSEETLGKSYSLPDTPIIGQSSRKQELKKNDMTDDEMHINEQPKLEISKDAINALKLKPIVLQTSSVNKRNQDEKPDSVRFGSFEFQQFKSELNEKLKNPISISRVPSFFDPKTSHKKDNIEVKNEDVIEDSLDMEKARATIQFEIESKLNILSDLKKFEALQMNPETKKESTKTLDDQGNALKETVSDVEKLRLGFEGSTPNLN